METRRKGKKNGCHTLYDTLTTDSLVFFSIFCGGGGGGRSKRQSIRAPD